MIERRYGIEMAADDFPFFPIQLFPERGRQSLYMCDPYPIRVEGGLLIGLGGQLTVDGVMNSLYDRELFPFVGGKQLSLRVEVQGACRVTLIHRDAAGQEVGYASRVSDRAVRLKKADYTNGKVQVFNLDFELMASEQFFGRWFFRIEPIRSDIKLRAAEWRVRNVEPTYIVPAFVICTFKREAQVIGNVEKLAAVLGQGDDVSRPPSLSLWSRLGLGEPYNADEEPPVSSVARAGLKEFGIFVVDNAGTLTREDFAPPSVQLIKQRNVGGAGGFGRGIFEAIQAGFFTHVVMLDDDADIDDLSITRMMNLLRLSDDKKLFVGGIQFDAYNPRHLADAGAYWTPEKFERPIARMAPGDAGNAEGRDALARNHQANFNGWWLFGGRIESFKTFGMPLPCFVHLDDIDFGVRVQLHGGRTVTVPGLAVWHEPFYAKVEGWFAYYNIRNELIRLSAHVSTVLAMQSLRLADSIERKAQNRVAAVSKRLRRRFRDFVNTYQYGSALLLAKAVEDFVQGPSLLKEQDAEMIHKEVMAVYREANANYNLRPNLPIGFVAENPFQGGKLYRLAQIYSRNGHRVALPGRKDANRITIFASRKDINWKWMRARQAWGYPDPASASYHVYGFDREVYTKVDQRFKKAIRLFDRKVRSAQADWQEAYPELTSLSFWSKLVGTF